MDGQTREPTQSSREKEESNGCQTSGEEESNGCRSERAVALTIDKTKSISYIKSVVIKVEGKVVEPTETLAEKYAAILSDYNSTFKPTKAALYLPKPVGGRMTVPNCKKEGWTVGIQLLIDIDDPTTLFKLKKEAASLGMTVGVMMNILKDLMENCTATICIESDINNNTAIQEITKKIKYIMGDNEFSHSLTENCKPVSACHANYGRGDIEGKYDAVTTKYHPGTMGVACMLIIAKSRTKDD